MQSPPPSETTGKAAGIISWLLLFIGLTPWFITEWSSVLDENVSWLMIGARRLLEGGGMLKTFYDGDPPLNILMYAPALGLSDVLHIPLWRGLFLYIAGLIAFACLLVWRLSGLAPSATAVRRQVM